MKRSQAYVEFTELFSMLLLDPDCESKVKPRLDDLWDQMTSEEQAYIEKLVSEAVARSKAKQGA